MQDILEVSWTAIKSSMLDKKIQSSLQWLEETNGYLLYLFDGPFKLAAKIKKTNPKNADQFDFETNYKAISNTVLQPKDSDNSLLSRTKVTKTGWQYQLHSIGFTVGKLNSVYNKGLDGVDLGYSSLKLYNAQDQEITDPLQEGQSTLTVLAWEPTHTLEILGGDYHQAAAPLVDIHMWVRALPHIPAVYGGSKDFLQGGINLRHVPVGAVVKGDGRTPKELPYVAGAGYTRMYLYFRHATGVTHSGQMIFELFKQ